MHRPWPEHACGTVCKIHWQGLTSIACWVVGFVQWWMLCTGNRRKTSSFEQPGWSYEPIQHTSTSQDGNNITQATVKNLLGLNRYWHLAPNCYGFFGKFAHVHCQCFKVFLSAHSDGSPVVVVLGDDLSFRPSLLFFCPAENLRRCCQCGIPIWKTGAAETNTQSHAVAMLFFTKKFLNKWYKYIYVYIYIYI